MSSSLTFIHASILWIFLLITFCAAPLAAQNPVTISYTVEDGLPSNEVYDAYEDRAGNIWFATDHGISKYDGYGFQNFSTKDGLTDNTVFGFLEDAVGRIWMRCLNGTLCFMQDERIYPYPHNQILLDQLKGGFFIHFDIDQHFQMYFLHSTSRLTTMILDLKTGRIRALPLPSGPMAALIPSGDPQRRIGGISITDHFTPTSFPEGQMYCTPSLKYWTLPLSPQASWSNGRNLSVSVDDTTDIGIYNSGIYKVQGCHLTHWRPLKRFRGELRKDPHGRVWLLGRGMSILDQDLNFSQTFFPAEIIFDLLQDTKDRYWICTHRGVLFVRNLNFQLFDQFTDGENVRRLRRMDSTLYILHGDFQIERARITHDSTGLTFQPVELGISAYLQDFLVVKKDSVFLVIRSIQDLVQHDLILEGDSLDPMSWQLRINDHYLFMAYRRGFAVLDLKTRFLRYFFHTVLQHVCTAIIQDLKGTIWVGTNRGLYSFDGHQFAQFQPDNPLTHIRVTDLALLPDGTLIVSTRGEGLLAIQDDRILNFNENHQLPSNMCGNLFVGTSGLWVCSNKGLSLIMRKQGKKALEIDGIYNWTTLDGFPSNKVNDVIEFDGVVYAATDKGLVTFKTFSPSDASTSTKIEQVLADGQRIDLGQQLSTDQDNLQFRFRAEKLNALGNLTYQYRLEGYDAVWRTTTENFVTYYNLPPGHYNFRVTAGYPYTQKSPLEASFAVDLPYRLHEHPLFQITGLGLLVFSSLFSARIYYKGRQRRLHSDYRRLNSEIKALRSQMNPHFIFNVLTSIQHLILYEDNETAQTHLAGFSKFMRAVLDASNHETIHLPKEIDILQWYLELEQLRFGDNFSYAIELEPGVDWEQYKIPPMLLQPIVENAIWHGLSLQKVNPKLVVRFSRSEEGGIYCEVEDNGIGRKAASERTPPHNASSVGLTNILERIRLINAMPNTTIRMEIIDLEQDGKPSGTLVKIYFKFQHG